MTRLKLLLAASGVAALAFASAAAAAENPRLTPISRMAFPQRGFILDLPRSAALGVGTVHVTENGHPVRQLRVTSTDASGLRFGVVLVVDASDSMAGKPYTRAIDAARAFIAHRSFNEAIGVIAFNSTVHIVQAPTVEPARLADVLTTPPALAHGTHIYDAVASAVEQLRARGFAGGSVILLSDGADTGSAATENAALAKAQREHVRVFTVGLKSGAFDPRPLDRLARESSATYAKARSSRELEPIYAALGERLAQEYVLRYRSTALSNTNVNVRVNIPLIGVATTSYKAPKPAGFGAYHRSLALRFLLSPLAPILLSLLVGALFAFAAVAVVRGPKRKLVARLARFVSVHTSTEPVAQRRSLVAHLLSGVERSLAKGDRWHRLERALEIGRIEMPAVQLVAWTALGTIVIGVIFGLVSPIFFVAAFAVPLLVNGFVKRRLERVRNAFSDQLPDTLQVLASSLRAGHSFTGALAVVVAEAPDPTKAEFQRVVADEQLGVPVEDGLRTVAARMDSRDLEQVAIVAELQREAGGNMAEVLDSVVETIRERFALRRLVKTLTAQGRLARWIVSLLPVGLALFLSLLNPGYMDPLFSSSGGRVLLVAASAMVVCGSLIIKKIINIKV